MTQQVKSYSHISDFADRRLLTDKHHRTISYLRISVTDRCNMRCQYCMPEEGITRLDHKHILSYEEFIRLIKLCLKLSITKVRLTGGEPLIRKGIIDFIKKLKDLPVPDLRLTTNGTLLEKMAGELIDAGIKRINVSLDTLQREKFQQITRRDELNRILRGLEKLLDSGMKRIKINVVAMRGVNDDEIADFARLAIEKPFSVRFIEYMPLEKNGYRKDMFISSDEVLKKISQIIELTPIESKAGDGPARRYKVSGGKGEIGLISPMSHHFCPSCNRLRLTADGKLLSCLFSDKETDLCEVLRSGATDDELLKIIEKTVNDKPKGHQLSENNRRSGKRPMGAIGG